MKQGQRILLIDDSNIDRTMLAKVLRMNGFDVNSFPTGENIIDKIKAYKPDAVLLDVLMPEVDGNSILEKIRAEFSSLALPVIMITSQKDSKNIVRSLSLGANDYIAKPIDFEVSIMRIQTQLSLVNLSREAAKTKELRAISAMVATYNHEINNPLTIALLTINKFERGIVNQQATIHQKDINILTQSIDRVCEIVRNIEGILSHESIELEVYQGDASTIKLNQSKE